MKVRFGRVLFFILFMVLALLAILGLLWIDHTRETILPKPSGSFAVGRTMLDWSDTSQVDSMAPHLGSKRELAAWIWYPAKKQRTSVRAEYLPLAWRKALEHNTSPLFTNFLNRDYSRVRANSFLNAAISPLRPSYPVIIMRAGLAALTTDYTALAEDLASHGYVVVGFDAPYRTTVVVFQDRRVILRAPENNAELLSGVRQEQLAGKLVKAWSADMSFALDQLERLNAFDPSGKFTRRLDMRKVGVFGHSLGGASALQFCSEDIRCNAVVDLDGAPLGSVVTKGVNKPLMFVPSDHHGEPKTETMPVESNIRSIYNRLPANRRMYIFIKGSNHYMFSDNAFLKSPGLMSVLRLLGILGIDGQRQVLITTHYLSAFFDVYLNGKSTAELHHFAFHTEIEEIW